MTDITCSKCGFAKPEDAYPQKHGKRVGRQCRACLSVARRRHAPKTPSGRARFDESRRQWSCPKCGRRFPDVYPATTSTRGTLSPAIECHGCHSRETARRRKERTAA